MLFETMVWPDIPTQAESSQRLKVEFKTNVTQLRTKRTKMLKTHISMTITDLTNLLTPLAHTAGVLATLVDQIQTDGSAYQTALSAVSASLVGFRDTDCAGSLPDSLYSVCSVIPDETPFITTVLPLSMVSCIECLYIL